MPPQLEKNHVVPTAWHTRLPRGVQPLGKRGRRILPEAPHSPSLTQSPKPLQPGDSPPSLRPPLPTQPHPASTESTPCPWGPGRWVPHPGRTQSCSPGHRAARGGLGGTQRWAVVSSLTGRRRQMGDMVSQHQPGALCGGPGRSPRAEGGLWREGPPRAHLSCSQGGRKS